MIIDNNLSRMVFINILKDFASKHIVTSLARKMNVSRVGMWKTLKKLESEELIKLEPVGKGKTSAYQVTLNWNNPLTEKALSFYLTQEALRQKRWQWNFEELEPYVDFTVLYGSILHSPENANDIDIINIVSNKKSFIKIEEIISKKQIAQQKKIHDINFTLQEFKNELKKPNKAFVHAVQTGVILYGQEKFVKFMRGIV